MTRSLVAKVIVLSLSAGWCAFSQPLALDGTHGRPNRRLNSEPASGGPAGELGSVTEIPDPCPLGAGTITGTTCKEYRVSCPGLNDMDAQVRVTPPADGIPPRGTVVFGTGGAGINFYAGAPDVPELVASLTALGFRIVDRVWPSPDGWLTAEGGLKKQSCRYATLLTWIHDHIHTGGKFVASGISDGSSELGYALTSWGRASILDLAIPTSGPTMGRMDYVCAKKATPQWASLCASIVPANTMQCSPESCVFGTLTGPLNICIQVSPQPTTQQLWEDSVVNPDAVLNYPNTLVHFIYGEQDCGEPVPNGLTYATAVTSQRLIEFVPNAPHDMPTTPEGRAAILQAIDDGTK
jgi:hypothetical protein